jgi:mono/diheme cytochrome c family protein
MPSSGITLIAVSMKARRCLSILIGISLAVSIRAQAKDIALLPPSASQQVDFVKDIQPILEKKCVQCHGRGHDKGGFRLETRELLLGESDNGKSVQPGKSADSFLIHMVAGLDPEEIMPKKGARLTTNQVAMFRAWIDQGVVWPAEVNFAKKEPQNLRPTPVVLPNLRRDQSPIDGILSKYYRTHHVGVGREVDDETFLRRIYLDLAGLLPSSADLEAFSNDRNPDKREALISGLLSADTLYAQNWITFWNDLLRNDYRGAGYIDKGRKQISDWLYQSLLTNKPYDKFVAELVHPTEESEGFSKGIVWRGAVNASQLPPIQAAQNISQVFMGVNLKCASCHDSFIDDWKLADAYGLAAVYSDEALELVECDKPVGRMAKLSFLYPELGTITPSTNKADRTEQLAQIITAKDNGRLPRTIVNRLWQRFFGRGLVEPVDVMDGPSWNPALLNWLAEDLVAHHYDLRHTMSVMLNSRAYQAEAVDESIPEGGPFTFKGPLVRRMTAEQFVDSVSQLTGVWQDKPAASFGLSTNQLKALEGRTRAAMVAADPLMSALDRPTREQLVTVRQATPTTLQALEVTNGKTLAETLKQGATRLAEDAATIGPKGLTTQIYQQAFSREPTRNERRLALALLGENPSRESIEDFLWAVVVQPEFQLIY